MTRATKTTTAPATMSQDVEVHDDLLGRAPLRRGKNRKKDLSGRWGASLLVY
ncbi:MAG: hypothetical protein MZV64_49370 [Ignavibacteriales bacterium]|nr:hypothetical protein [Ignavibacteriales bacterium]